MKKRTPIMCEDIQLEVLAYEPPKIEVVEISVEKGFADSTEDWGNENW